MEGFVGEEKEIRRLGISNYTVADYQELRAAGIKVKPFVNQFEVNPGLYRKKTIDWFQEEGMRLISC